MKDKGVTYKTFISYSHKDKSWGDWLHKQLETYSIPKSLRAELPKIDKNLYPIFRDREELPGSADLGANISDALANSDTLLIICSPNSANSLWVNQEIIDYQKVSPNKPIIALIIDGNKDSSDQENYCFPSEVEKLLNQYHIKLIDGRTTGKSQVLRLEIVSHILGIEINKFKLANRKKKIKSNIVKIFILLLLGVGGWFSWEKIKKNRSKTLIAESQSLAIKAQQALNNDDMKNALLLSIQALPKNMSNPEQPVNATAESVLNQVLEKPLISILKGKIPGEIVKLFPTDNISRWIVTDTEGVIYLFDITTGKSIWNLEEKGYLEADINQQKQLIVRTKNGLTNYDMATGKLNCEMTLDTQEELAINNSLGWIQKNWIIESTGSFHKTTASEDVYRPKHIQFLNTTNCTSSKLHQIPGFIKTSISLVDVLPDGKKITVRDTYNDKGAANIYDIWPANENEKPITAFSIPGSVVPLFELYFNRRSYNGPLIKTLPNENVSIFAFKPDDKTGYIVAKMDWQQSKFTLSNKLESMPSSLIWQGSNNQDLSIELDDLKSSGKSKYFFIDTSDFKLKKTISLKKRSKPILSPLEEFALTINSTVEVTNTQSGYTEFSTQKLNMPSSYHWLNKNTAIYSGNNGEILTLHIKNNSPIKKLNTENCCYKTIDNDTGLVEGLDGVLYRINPENLEETELFRPTHYDTSYKYLEKYNMVFIDEKIKESTTQEHIYKLIKLPSSEVIWEKQLEKTNIKVGQENLSYLNDNNLIIIDYSQPGKEIIFKKPEFSQLLSINTDGTEIVSLNSEPILGKSPLNLEVIDVRSNKVLKQTDSLFNEFSYLDKLYISNNNQSIVHLAHKDDKITLKIANIESNKITQLGELNDSISYGLGLNIDFYGDYLYTSTSYGDSGFINTKTALHHVFSAEEKTHPNEELLKLNQVVISNIDKKQLFLFDLNTQKRHLLNCPFSNSVSTTLYMPSINSVGIIADGLCIIDLDSFNVKHYISSPSKDYVYRKNIVSLALYNKNKITVITNSNIAISKNLESKWHENIKDASNILTLKSSNVGLKNE